MGLRDVLRPSLDGGAFAELVIRRLTSVAAAEAIRFDPESFALELPGRSTRLFLGNAHREFNASPLWRRRQVVERFVSLALAMGDSIPDDFLAARRRLLPVVRSGLFFEGIHGPRSLGDDARPLPTIATRPLGDDYQLALALDGEQSLAYVTAHQLERWKVPFERALEYGLDNLTAASAALERVAPGVFVSSWQDNYDCSRLLQPQLFRGLALRGRPVVAIPHRDCLIVTGEDDPRGLVELARRAAREDAHPRPIGLVPLVLGEDGWSTFLPDGEDAGAVAIRNLVRRGRAQHYGEQRALLEDKGLGPKVASCEVMRQQDAPELVTVCAWTEGEPNLLPKTDLVSLRSPSWRSTLDALGPFPWSWIAEQAGEALTRTEHRPERWLTRGFPSDAAIRALLRRS